MPEATAHEHIERVAATQEIAHVHEREPEFADAERIICADEPQAFDAHAEHMQRALEKVRAGAPEFVRELETLYARALAAHQSADEAEERLLQESTIDGVPFSVLRGLYGSFVRSHADLSAAERKDAFWQSVERRGDAEGWQQLESFLATADHAYDFLRLDRDIPVTELRARYAVLDELYTLFKAAPLDTRAALEDSISEMFGVPTAPKEVEDYLARVAAEESTVRKAGAENENSIFFGKETGVRVLKLTKGRHDADFTSVLKLMRDMHAVALECNAELPEAHVQIQAAFKDMTVFKDQEGRYKRLIRQDFAPGVSMKALDSSVKESPEFMNAWQAFLQHTNELENSYGVVLDLSDSDAGMKPERGDISKTGNVFVRVPDEAHPEYLFTVIDPDVFDTRAGEHKFDPKEYLRNEPGIQGVIDYLKMHATNFARERVVKPWQDRFMEQTLRE